MGREIAAGRMVSYPCTPQARGHDSEVEERFLRSTKNLNEILCYFECVHTEYTAENATDLM